MQRGQVDFTFEESAFHTESFVENEQSSKLTKLNRELKFCPNTRKIKEYLGDIDFFLEQRKVQSLREVEKKDDQPLEKTKQNGGGRQSYEAQKRQKSIQNKLSKVESQIDKLEKELAEIDVELAINYDETIAQPNFFDNYQAKKTQLEQLMSRWEELSASLE